MASLNSISREGRVVVERPQATSESGGDSEGPLEAQPTKKASNWMMTSLTMNAFLLLAVLLLSNELSNGAYRKATSALVSQFLASDDFTAISDGAESVGSDSSSKRINALVVDPCSGNGNYYPVENGRKVAYCRCYPCFTGEDCSLVTADCVIDVYQGDPTLFEKYWINNPAITSIYDWEHTSYAADLAVLALTSQGNFFTEPALEQAIRDVHAVVGNAVTEGRNLVIGNGASQIYQAALYALATGTTGSSSAPMSVVCAAPFYSMYPAQTNLLKSTLFTWVGDARTFNEREKETIASYNYVEVVTSPNNPTGDIQDPVVEGGPLAATRVVYDYAYYWPTFTPITGPKDKDVMIFTLSKCTGHAGGRVGWAIVKDAAVAERMATFITFNSLGVSRDSQYRASRLLRAAMKGYSSLSGDDPRQVQPQRTISGDVDGFVSALFHYGSSEMGYRWAQMRSVFQNTTSFNLRNHESAYCNFFGESSSPTPAYAWVRCNFEGDCEQFFKSHGVLTRGGAVCGVDATYVRISLLERRQNFDLLVNRLREIVNYVG